MITIFKDGYDLLNPHFISVQTALKRIKEGKSKATCEAIWKATDEKEITKLKLTLPSVLFHGKFEKEVEKEYKTGAKAGQKYLSKRDDTSITEYSGYLVLDFDKCDVEAKKRDLSKDPYIYAAWVSPSGKGVKALIKVPQKQEHHYQYYAAILEKYKDADPTSRSLSRLCFESYDPAIHINEQSKIWEKRKIEIDRTKEKICVDIILNAPSGQGHYSCLKAAYLAGGFTASGLLNEAQILPALKSAAQIRRPNEVKDSESAIEAAFRQGTTHPLSDLTDMAKVDDYVRSIFSRKRSIDPSKYVVTREKIVEASTMYNEDKIQKARGLGIPELDHFLVFRDNSFYTITGGKGAGKSTTMLYLYTLDAIKNASKSLMVMYENDHFEAEQEVIGFKVQNQAKWVYNNRRKEYEDAADFFHEHFTILNIPPDFTIYDIFELAGKVNSQSKYHRLFIDPLFKVPDTEDYAKNKKIASYCEPFATDIMSLYISMHPTGKAQREGGQPRDLDAEFGSMYSNAADITMTIARNYKSEDESERNTVNLAIDKMRSKRLYGGSETYKDCPIKFEWMWKRHGYRMYVPSINQGGGYVTIDNPIDYLQGKEKPLNLSLTSESSIFDEEVGDAPF